MSDRPDMLWFEHSYFAQWRAIDYVRAETTRLAQQLAAVVNWGPIP